MTKQWTSCSNVLIALKTLSDVGRRLAAHTQATHIRTGGAVTVPRTGGAESLPRLEEHTEVHTPKTEEAGYQMVQVHVHTHMCEMLILCA